nr:hypothetical protein CFP56_32356 [Quercus suber]
MSDPQEQREQGGRGAFSLSPPLGCPSSRHLAFWRLIPGFFFPVVTQALEPESTSDLLGLGDAAFDGPSSATSPSAAGAVISTAAASTASAASATIAGALLRRGRGPASGASTTCPSASACSSAATSASPAAAAAAAAGAFHVPDVEAADAAQAHLADDLLVEHRGLRAAEGAGVVVGGGDEALVGELQLAGEGLVEAEPGLVGLVLGGLVDAGEGGGDGGGGGRGRGIERVRVRGDGQVPVDLQEEGLGRGEQQDGAALGAGARGAPDAVHVLLAAGRQAQLHDEADVGEVHAAADDVRREHDAGAGLLEGGGGAGACGLGQARVQLRDLDLAVEEVSEEGVHERDAVGRDAEHDRLVVVRLQLVLVQQQRVQGRVQLLHGRRDDGVLLHAVDGQVAVVRIDRGETGVAGLKDFGQDFVDFGGHRGAEAEALPSGRLRGKTAEDVVDRFEESSFKHGVGFVQDEGPDMREFLGDEVVGEIVVEAAGRRNDDFGIARQKFPEIPVFRRSSVRRVALEGWPQLRCDGVAFFGDLQRQLTRRGHDEDGDLTLGHIVAGQQ